MIKDEDGYYNVIVSTGCSSDMIKHNFDDTAVFKSMLDHGLVCGEVGHPVRPHNVDGVEFTKRVVQVDADKICCRWKELIPDYTDKANVVLNGKFKPFGIRQGELQEQLDLGVKPIFGLRGIKLLDRSIISTIDLIGFDEPEVKE